MQGRSRSAHTLHERAAAAAEARDRLLLQTIEHRHCGLRPRPAALLAQRRAPDVQTRAANARGCRSHRRPWQEAHVAQPAPAASIRVRPSLPPFNARSRSSHSSRRASASMSRRISGGSQGRSAQPSASPSLAGRPPPMCAVLQQAARPELSGRRSSIERCWRSGKGRVIEVGV